MASRQQEKEARRRARLEQEEREQRAAARRKRLQLIFGAGLAVAIVVAVAVVALAGGGSKDSNQGGAHSATKVAGVTLPPQKTTNIDAAVKAAGCKLTHPPDEGRTHIVKTFHESDYHTNPPTSGAHYPIPASDGVYDPGNSPALGRSVHALEHGRIEVQYAPGTPKRLIRQLQAFVNENGGTHMLLFQNTTHMPTQVAATAWDQLLTCNHPNPRMWDALRTFRDRYLDQAPEQIPGPE